MDDSHLSEQGRERLRRFKRKILLRRVLASLIILVGVSLLFFPQVAVQMKLADKFDFLKMHELVPFIPPLVGLVVIVFGISYFAKATRL